MIAYLTNRLVSTVSFCRRADDTLTVFDPSVRVMFAIIQRNVRCLLAYHYNRLMFIKNMRWEFGSIIPPEMKANMSASEIEWMSSYSNNLTRYMRSLGENGMNLQIDLKPPKSVYIDVKCLVDYGTLELSDGTVVLLKKNSMHYLPRVECEDLIRRGVFEHIMY